jgi:hypothetical protein
LITLLPLGVLALLAAPPARAGGPKYVAGVSYFNSSVVGKPIVWAGGQLTYFVDQGPLTGAISNVQATAMVDAAAQVWNTIPTAAVSLIDGGSLAEDVDLANIQISNGAFQQPADLAPTATATPVGVVFDLSGSIIDALYGSGASQPENCSQNGVFMWIDNFNPNATFAHGIILLNGRCATGSNLIAMMQYQLERAFGRLLGLDYAQVNDNALSETASEPNAWLAWPIMDPVNGTCGVSGGTCIPNPTQPRTDDIAALNRLYPITSANIAGFPGKVLTTANTISIQGTVRFPSGQGMQGVNVVARPLDANGNPLYQYTATAVSGVLFAGNRGNPVSGFTDANGNRLDRFGSDAPALQGAFDLSGIPMPPGTTSATYQVTFEPINPLYIDNISVGPYILATPTPSGTLAAIRFPSMQPGSSQSVTVTANGGASAFSSVAIGSEIDPQPVPAQGLWLGRLGAPGQTDWLALPVRTNRLFTIFTQALDESGAPSASKALPAIGVWDGYDSPGTAAAGWVSAQNGLATGETWIQVTSSAPDIVRIGIADQRGDGRPDYLYRGRVLYADTVTPAHVPPTGGTIVIRGSGFRAGDTVTIGNASAIVSSISPTEITAIVPAAASGVSGSQDVTVSDQPNLSALATIPGGVSYDAAKGDNLHILTAPSGQVSLDVPQPFSVLAESSDGTPASGVSVLYLVTSGAATLGCGKPACTVTATGDGRATLTVSPTGSGPSVVTASLTNGTSVQAHFSGGPPAALTALTPPLYLAAGATVAWPVQAIALSRSGPAAGLEITWISSTGITAPTGSVATNSAGIASTTLSVGPLAEGQTANTMACLNGTTTCVTFTVFGARPEFASVAAISGTSQSLALGSVASNISLHLFEINGNPMAGGSVTVTQTLTAWAPPCPRQGRCPSAPVLAEKSTTLTSALDGSVTFAPLTQPGVAYNLAGLATTGNSSSLAFQVEVHP